jgi:hypothetical protein
MKVPAKNVRSRPRACPWANHPTHSKNKQLQVNGERPVVYGYCGQDTECASCAGTLFKPNLLIQQGRSFEFVECPYCTPELYRKRVTRLKPSMPVGSGPTSTPLDAPAEPEAPKKGSVMKKRGPSH